ncbi:hypothetical protein C0995_009459, partial [Termitomyces sp. Mi166
MSESEDNGHWRKRVRLKHNQFLDIEADVDDDDPEAKEEKDDDDDFIEDNGPVTLDRSLSHHLLLIKQNRVEGDAEWDALLARARSRSQRLSPNESSHQSAFIINALSGEISLWRVAVKPGYEETAAFILMEKVFRSKSGTWDIKSIIGRVSRPGWIVVEAPRLANVQELCRGISDVHWRQGHVVDLEDSPSCLKEQKLFIPSSASWVRLTQRPFTGNLAYVADYSHSGAEVYVVPHLSNRRRLLTGKRKCVGVQSSISRSFRLRCPDTALLDVAEIKAVWENQCIQMLPSGECCFHGQTYLDRFLRLSTDEFQPKEAVPTSAEIKCFQNLRLIPVECFERALQRLSARSIGTGDNVKIIEGGARGAIGVVYNIIGETATVDINNEDVQLTVFIDWLRKAINIGDKVVVAYGDQQGFTGWIEALTESINFYHHPILMNSHSTGMVLLAFHGGMEDSKSDIDASQLKKDPNLRFLGHHVRVIGQHRLKNYKGIIKTTLRDNDILVELKATLHQESLHLWNLAHRHDPHMKLLVPPPSEGAEAGTEDDPFVNIPPNDISPPPGADIPLLALPLTASMPLPPSTSVSLTPAWNPSSRTPITNPASAF